MRWLINEVVDEVFNGVVNEMVIIIIIIISTLHILISYEDSG